MRRIVYTRPDGGVNVCTPSATALRFMTNGGGRWGTPPRGFLDRQIVAQSAHGVGERNAHRFVMAMHAGGCTEAIAMDIMRDRFCSHLGTACELVDAVPTDRWFRDAWRRSHNGGPICVAMPVARDIQLRRIEAAAKRSKASIQMPRWRVAVRRAQSPEELRALWPERLRSVV